MDDGAAIGYIAIAGNVYAVEDIIELCFMAILSFDSSAALEVKDLECWRIPTTCFRSCKGHCSLYGIVSYVFTILFVIVFHWILAFLHLSSSAVEHFTAQHLHPQPYT